MAKLVSNAPVLKSIPTGFPVIDIMLGENERDPKTGKLVNVLRGIPIGQQGILAGVSGSGKSTLAMAMATYGISAGYPCHAVIVIDVDEGVYKEHRLRYVTELENPLEKVKVYRTSVLETAWDALMEENKIYKDCNYKPVEYVDIVTGKKEKMMPYVIVIFDTLTNIKTSIYSGDDTVKNAKDALSKESDMQTALVSGNLAKSINNLFDGNIAVMWITHTTEKIQVGPTPPTKDFKSMPQGIKINAGKVIKGKSSWAFLLHKVIDSVNRDQTTNRDHLNNRLNLDTRLNAYSVLGRMFKSRTGTEAQSETEIPNIATKFDRTVNIILDCSNMGIFKELSSRHPSDQYPLIFKDKEDDASKEAYNSLCRLKRTALTMDGYDRQFNLLEAYALVRYNGDNPEIINERRKFLSCCMQNLEKELEFELEVNNMNISELSDSQAKLHTIFDIYGSFDRVDVLDKDHEIKKSNIEKLNIEEDDE